MIAQSEYNGVTKTQIILKVVRRTSSIMCKVGRQELDYQNLNCVLDKTCLLVQLADLSQKQFRQKEIRNL